MPLSPGLSTAGAQRDLWAQIFTGLPEAKTLWMESQHSWSHWPSQHSLPMLGSTGHHDQESGEQGSDPRLITNKLWSLQQISDLSQAQLPHL